MCVRVLVGWACLAFVLTASSTNAAIISITQGSLQARAWDGSGGLSEEILTATLPMNASSTLSDNTASNTTNYDFSNSGFRINVEHSRPTSANNNQAQTNTVVPVRFTLDQDADYSIDGNYSQSGNGRIVYFFELLDVTGVQTTVFRNQQISYNTAGESFALGLLEGDAAAGEKFLSGSLAGTLLAGRTYQLSYNFLLQRWTANSAASANGFFHLQIGVPEPWAVPMVLLGTIGFGILRYPRETSLAVTSVHY